MIRASYDDQHPHLPPSITEPKFKSGGYEASDLFDADYGKPRDSKNNNELRHRKATPDIGASDKSKLSEKINSLMNSKGSEAPRNEAAEALKTLTELLLYILFLVTLSFAVFAMTTSSMYYTVKIMSDLFIGNAPPGMAAYSDIGNMDDIWNYFENQLLDGLYWNDSKSTNNESSMIYYQNKLLGQPRLRMLKVNNQSCEVFESFQREISECFGSYKPSREDKNPIGSGNFSAALYHEAKDLKSGSFSTAISTYGGGGFVQALPYNDKEAASDIIALLKANRWIDRGTRVIFVDLTTYNANLNLFNLVKLVIELPATGGVVPQYYITPMKLFRYVTTFDYVVLSAEAIFCVLTLFYILQECVDIFTVRLSYFCSFWNVFESVVLALSVTTIAFTIRLRYLVYRKADMLATTNNEYIEMNEFKYAYTLANDLTAILVFVSWLKFFKFVNFNKTMYQLSATLQRSVLDVIAFAVMFLIFFFAFAQFAYIVFGTQMYDYSTFDESCLALLRLILGDFDYAALQRANRYLGPLFFITYVFFVFFVLLNMFLAIINDSYVEVKSYTLGTTRQIELVEYARKKFYQFLGAIHLAKNPKSVATTPNYLEWKESLIKCGYSEDRINEAFIRFDVEDHQHIDKKKQQIVEEHLANSVIRKNGEVIWDKEDKEKFESRMYQIENAVSTVDEKLRAIMFKLNQVEIDDALKQFDEYYNDKKFQ